MVFIRAKEIKGKDYYYLVKSTRRGGKVHQKTLKYLGSKVPDQRRIDELRRKYKKTRN